MRNIILVLAILSAAACGDGRDHVGVELPDGSDTGNPDAGVSTPVDDAGTPPCECPQDDSFCNGAEVCTSAGECVHTGDPCRNGTTCDESHNGCLGRPTCNNCPDTCEGDLDCDDGVFCNGAERCFAGNCEPGDLPPCDDSFVCTIGVCVASPDACLQVPDSSICNEGEYCSTSSGCTTELPDCPTCPPVTPDAGVPGTPDAGVSDASSPPLCTTSQECDDGDACTYDVCDLAVGCKNSLVVNCDDGDPCTVIDECNPNTGGCIHSLLACEEGFSCVAGECVCDTQEEPECESHSDCLAEDKRKCLDGTCVQCYENWHCGLYSVLPCGDSCLPPPVCDLQTNTCVYQQ